MQKSAETEKVFVLIKSFFEENCSLSEIFSLHKRFCAFNERLQRKSSDFIASFFCFHFRNLKFMNYLFTFHQKIIIKFGPLAAIAGTDNELLTVSEFE